MRYSPQAVILFSFLLLSSSACSSEPAMLEVALDGNATASAQYFHGNCFAGYSIALRLRVRETQGVDVTLDRFALTLSDRATGAVVVSEVLDANGLEERYGSGANRIPGNGSLVLAIGAPSQSLPGDVSLSGELQGHERDGAPVAKSFQLAAPVVELPVTPASSGACSP